MGFVIFLLICLLIAVIVMPFVAMAKASSAERRARDLSRKIDVLETKLYQLSTAFVESRQKPPQQQAPPSAEPTPVAVPEVHHQPPPWTPSPEAVPAPPKLAPEPPAPAPSREHVFENVRAPAPAPTPVPFTTPVAPEAPPAPVRAPVNWEQFMGAKLFAWVGGLALFLGVAFFIKYSFDKNLIPPEMRAAIGFLAGLGLLAGGIVMKRKETAVTAQTLCSTGILVLYGVTFACRSFYNFPFFQLVPTFLLMTLITAAAFLLAVKLDAMVVAILGIAGGFLTPVLLSTGQDAPLALFGYITLLDAGLLAVALRKRWTALSVLGAIGTIVMQGSWLAAFFVPGKYSEGNKIFVAMAVFAGFEALFIIAVALAGRAEKAIRTLTGAALAMCAAALGISFFFLCFEAIGNRPATLFAYVFLVDAGVILLVLLERKIAAATALAGLAVFAVLATWTGFYISPGHLYMALGLYFVFALFHSATPVVLHKMRGDTLPAWCNAFPALALVLVLMPILTLPGLSLLIWPLVLLIDVLAVILAVVTMTVGPILVVLLLTLVATGAWIFRIPSDLTGLPTSLFMLGGFAVFFIVAATLACRRLEKQSAGDEAGGGLAPQLFGPANAANLSVQIPALSAVLPFVLLIMITTRLPLANPSPVFSLALLLVVLLIGLAKTMALDILPAVGLVSVIALEHAWHLQHFDPAHAAPHVAWYLVFYFVFTVYPFLFHRQYAESTVPWVTAALAGPLHFYLVYDVARASWPGLSGAMGLLPAAFSVPALLGVVALLKRTPAESPARNAQLAWFGGIALFFITLIFPIQFEREWITIGWALEGAALCWLLHRVPHRGLGLAGAGLLLAAFARLALNPAVLDYHARSAMPILNWYLYAYGITTACLFAGAWLLAPPRNLVLGGNAPPLLYGCGIVLAFLLVNIEITDFFTPPGTESLTFEFSGIFARDMSYSIAWALFALLLLVVGIAKKLAAVRYASIGLLAVTLLKLLFHDLWQLGQLYRIASLIVVAVIAIFASFLYQRFFGAAEKEHGPPPAPPAVP